MYFNTQIAAAILILRALKTDRPKKLKTLIKELGITTITANLAVRRLESRALLAHHGPFNRGYLRHRRWRQITLYDVYVAFYGERDDLSLYPVVADFQNKVVEFFKTIKIYDENEDEYERRGWIR